MSKKEMTETPSDVFLNYVNDTIARVEKNRDDPIKYIKNTVPDDVVPYKLISEEDANDGTE